LKIVIGNQNFGSRRHITYRLSKDVP
jgi:hypothetical protein